MTGMEDRAQVINIMADGTACGDLAAYLDGAHPLPPDAQRMLLELMRSGAGMRARLGGGA